MLALALAAGAHQVMNVIVNPCSFLTPDGWLWWWYDCPTAPGGGGSGAGD